MRSLFTKFHDYQKRDYLYKSSCLYILCGIPIVVFFSIADQSVVGIDNTLCWRMIGLSPMIVSLLIYITLKILKKPPHPFLTQWIGTAITIGVTTMMAGLLFKVITSKPAVDTVVLAGTVAGNLLAVFAGGSLRGLLPSRTALALSIPYIAIIVVFAMQKETSSIQWVFIGNVILPIPALIFLARQRERGDSARLLALFNLQEEREHLEETVAERTKELEILLKELHHSVRNNLQTILSVFNLYKHDSLNNPDIRFRMIRRAVQIIAIAHDLTHHDKVLEKVCMNLFLEKICSNRYWLEEGFSVNSNIEETWLKTDIAVIIGFICIHLIAQTKKYCHINFFQDKHGFTLIITIDHIPQDPKKNNTITELLAGLIGSDIKQELSDKDLKTRILIPEI